VEEKRMVLILVRTKKEITFVTLQFLMRAVQNDQNIPARDLAHGNRSSLNWRMCKIN
jgi:hypothetical protein